jgi:putative intracellular protease/amidase
VSLAPGGRQVASASGFRLTPDRGTAPDENVDLDAVAVIGSDRWTAEDPLNVAPLLDAVASRGGIVGGICAGTLALARAGLFKDAAHTSNGRDWILKNEPGYAGAEHYVDVPHAVADGSIVSAPGSASGTFAHRFLLTLYPAQEAQLAEMKTIFAREYAAAS